MKPKLRRKSFLTVEGKVALMFLKMYTCLSCPKLMEQLNGNIHYQSNKSQTRKMTRRLLELLGKILKEHYDLKRVKARTKLTEILYIFFGIHTANVVQLADRIEQRAQLAAA